MNTPAESFQGNTVQTLPNRLFRGIVRFFYCTLAALIVLIAAEVPAKANLLITPIFDSSITRDPNALGIENTIDAAIGVFESTYSNPIDVTIEFQEGSALGYNQEGFVYTETYHAFYDALVDEDANPAAIAGLTQNGGNSWFNPVTDSMVILVKSANMRALGLGGEPLCDVIGAPGSLTCNSVAGGANAVDGIISLNTAITYPPQPNNSSEYSLMAVTEHEIDEVLGAGSAIPDTRSGIASASTPAPDDLFRYTANGTFASLTVNCSAAPIPVYFSYSGATDLAQFNNSCNGGDFGNWQSNPLPAGARPEVQDAFQTPGARPAYGPNEIALLTAIGYVDPPPPAAPEPGTWILLLISAALFAHGRARWPRFIARRGA